MTGGSSFTYYVLRYVALPLFWPFNLIFQTTGATGQGGHKSLCFVQLVQSVAQISLFVCLNVVKMALFWGWSGLLVNWYDWW